MVKGLLVVWRVLLKLTCRLVPQWNPCKYEKFMVPVFVSLPQNGLVQIVR